MAASLSTHSPLFLLHDRSSTSCSLATPHRPLSLSPSFRFSQQKEIFGTTLLLQSLPSLEDAHSGRQHFRLTVEAAKRVDNGRSYVLSSTLIAQEGNEEKVAKLCESIRQWGLEKQKNKQSGIKQFECYIDTHDNKVFHFWEQYDSFLNMNDIRASPEHTKFMSDVRPFLSDSIALAAYEYRDGKIGHMLNPIGPKGEGGLDDATGQSGRGGENYMQPSSAKTKVLEGDPERRQDSSAINPGLEGEPEGDKWSFEKILARVIGADKEKAEGWSLKSLFGGKK